MPPKKKKRSCPFSSAKRRPKKSKKSFDKEWASKLAESDEGSLYKQEKWLEDYASDQKSKDGPVSASRSTIYLNCYMKSGSFIANKTIIIHSLTATNIILCPKAVYLN